MEEKVTLWYNAESGYDSHLTQACLNSLGDPVQEEFSRRAAFEARRQNLQELAREAEAWLTFSRETRLFEHEVGLIQRRMKRRA